MSEVLRLALVLGTLAGLSAGCGVPGDNDGYDRTPYTNSNSASDSMTSKAAIAALELKSAPTTVREVKTLPKAPKVADGKPLVDKYCVGCHNGAQSHGHVRLDSDAEIKNNAQKAYNEVNNHKMPPSRATQQPTDSDRQILLDWLRSLY